MGSTAGALGWGSQQKGEGCGFVVQTLLLLFRSLVLWGKSFTLVKLQFSFF